MDLDDFSSGYALWSGTSFAAPGFLGWCLQRWLDHPDVSLGDVTREAAVKFRQ